MNKATIGDGVRTERHDRDVVAATIEAKEKLRDQLGHGEEVRTEKLSRTEFLLRRMQETSANCDKAYGQVVVADKAYREALAEHQDAAWAYGEALAEEENNG